VVRECLTILAKLYQITDSPYQKEQLPSLVGRTDMIQDVYLLYDREDLSDLISVSSQNHRLRNAIFTFVNGHVKNLVSFKNLHKDIKSFSYC